MNIKPFEKKIWLATPTMHGDEMKYVQQAYDTNWMSTVGENINELERIAAEKAGMKYAVALSCCTAALHLCVKSAGERLYGRPAISHGALEGKRVFCSDMTFAATLNPVVYEGGIPIFVDTDPDTWNMDPIALERAFELYPDVKLVVYAELYGFPGRVDEIKRICERHGALLIEDAAEAMGATVNGRQCGSFGDYSAVSYNGNKIITGSSGGCLLTNDLEVANKARKCLDAHLDAEVKVEKSGRYIGVDCEVTGDVVVECDRCLDELELPVDVEILLSVKYGTEESSEEPQPGEREVIFVPETDAELDLSQIIYDYVCLSLPMQRTHEDGECNPEAMKYYDAPKDIDVVAEEDVNPFAALKGLFK